jgi:hypothetical protein
MLEQPAVSCQPPKDAGAFCGTVQLPSRSYPEVPPVEEARRKILFAPLNEGVNVSVSVIARFLPEPVTDAEAALTLHWLLERAAEVPTVTGPCHAGVASDRSHN